MESYEIQKGLVFLRKYLQDNPFDFKSLDSKQLQSWALKEIAYRQNDPIFQQRCKVRDIKKSHLADLAALHKRVSVAQSRYDASPYKKRLDELESAIQNSQKAIAGLTQALQNANPEKQQAMQEKLNGFKQKLDCSKKEYDELSQMPERQEIVRAKSDLDSFEKNIGLSQEEEKLQKMLTEMGQHSTSAGSNFEESAVAVIKRHIVPIVRKRHNLGRSQDIALLSQVTFGCARAELDYVLAICPGENVPVDVLAIVEVKRNPNDIVHGFVLRQENLAWFTGDQSGYDAAIYRTKVFRNGHFDVPSCHEENGKKFIFSKESFARFIRDAKTSYFMDGLFFITAFRHLWGMSADESSTFLYKLSTDVSFDVDSMPFWENISEWIKNNVSSFQTRDVLGIYASQKNWAHQSIFLSWERKEK